MNRKQKKFHYYIYHNEEKIEADLQNLESIKEVVTANPTIELEDHKSNFRTTICVKSDNFDLLNLELSDNFMNYWFKF